MLATLILEVELVCRPASIAEVPAVLQAACGLGGGAGGFEGAVLVLPMNRLPPGISQRSG